MASRAKPFSWFPYIVLIAVVVSWTGPWSHLPGHQLVQAGGSGQILRSRRAPFPRFSTSRPLGGGTSILASWLVILAHPAAHVADLRQVFAKTFKQMWGALLVAFFIFALAYIFVYTGMANSLAYGLSKIGVFFVVLAPILGWIGVALSGSNTSTNAMFGPVQAMTGRLLNLPVLLLPSFNSVGAGSGQTDRAADRQRGRFHQQAGAQRRPGHPSQHGLDARSPCLSNFNQRAFLLFFPEFHVLVGRASACLLFFCDVQNRQAEARPIEIPGVPNWNCTTFFPIIVIAAQANPFILK